MTYQIKAYQTNLHIGNPVLVFMHSEVCLRHFKQNKDHRVNLPLDLTKTFNKMWGWVNKTHRPAGL